MLLAELVAGIMSGTDLKARPSVNVATEVASVTTSLEAAIAVVPLGTLAEQMIRRSALMTSGQQSISIWRSEFLD